MKQKLNAHTPGPWRVTRHAEFLVKVETRNTVICDALGKLDEETLANARLIAAAPEMLAALERLEAGIRLWISRGVSDEDMSAARAAIAKAKGEA